ncbi:MAG: glycine cleavage system aminomethyltransferase GcvT [Solirubrobacterales bacterium]
MTTAQTERRTSLFDTHVEAGAKMVPFSGWSMPVSYDGIKEEHIAVRTHAGIFDTSHMGEIEVEGPGSLAYLQRLVTNDVSKIEIGGAQYSCLLNEDAGVIDDLFVYRLAHDRYLVITNAGNHEVDLEQFGRHARDFDVYVRDASSNYAMLAVQGPHARQIVKDQLHIELPPRMGVLAQQVGRRPALICGTGYTGEDGVELLIDPEIAPAIWAELVDAGVVPCGLGARDTLRLEVCFHLHGNDLSTDIDPISAGLGWACKEPTGFIGCDKVAVFRANGTDEKLAPFKIEGPGIPRPGNPVMVGDDVVGVVSSGTFSPSLGIGIGMAYLRSDLAEPGTEVGIDVRGKRRPARVSSKPLYSKEK